MRVAKPQREPLTGFVPGPETIYAQNRARDNEARAVELQRRHQDVTGYRAR